MFCTLVGVVGQRFISGRAKRPKLAKRVRKIWGEDRLRPGGIEKGGFPPSGASMTPVKITGYFFWLEMVKRSVKRSVKIWLEGCGKQLYQYEKHGKSYPQAPLKCHDSALHMS
jgi:hypothetical protein